MDITAWLESASIGVNVNVAHWSLNADAAVWGASGVGVQNVYKLGIISGQSVLVICMFKCGTGRIQA